MTPRTKRQRFESLARLAQAVTESLELPQVLGTVARAATDLLPGSGARIWVAQEDHLALVSEAGTLGPPRSGRKTELAFGEGLAGHVAMTRTVLAVEDILSDPRTVNLQWVRQQGYVSFVGIPLLVRDRLVGVLALLTRRRHRFTRDELEVLTSFGTQAAFAIENARLFVETRERLTETKTLLAVGRTLSLNLPTSEALRLVVRELARAFQADMGGAYFLDPRREALVPMAGYHVPKNLLQAFLDTPFPVSRFPILQEAWRTGKPVWTADAMSDPRLDHELLAAFRPRALLFAPTPIRGEMVGGIFLVWWTTCRAFGPAELGLMEGVASQVALALENAELARQTQDKLRETEMLLSVSRALSSTLDLETLVRHFLRHVARTIEADSVGVWLVDATTGQLEPVVGYHVPKHLLEPLRKLRLDLQASAFYAAGALSRRPMVSSNVPEDPRIPDALKAVAPHRAQLFAPIVAHDRLIGAFIAVWWRGAREFSERDLALVEAMASQVGVALENARLFQENKQKLEELSVLYEVSRAVTGQLEVPQIVDTICRQVGRVLDARNMVITFYREARWEFEVALRMVDGAPDVTSHERYPLGLGLMSRVVERRRPIRTSDYAETCRREGVEPVSATLPFPYWLGVPMVASDEVFGVLALRSSVRPFTDADERLLTNIASLAALAVRAARLFAEKTRAYRELDAAQEQLVRTEKFRALGEMATGVAHNFNNLLTPILGWAQLLLKTVGDPRLQQWLRAIEQAAVDGARTVRRIQEFTRPRREQPFVSVDLNGMVQEALDVTQSRWRDDSQSKGIVIRLVSSLAAVPPVAGDPVELREGLVNLILNAVDAMPEGGTLSLATEAVGDRVVVTVSDTGVGMSEDVKRRVFDPFFTTKGALGTGLGLSMTYGIVSRHGGEIAVQSSGGEGSTFRLSFPVSRSLRPEPDVPPPPIGTPLRCLVVDDQEQVRAVLGDLLRAGGHEPVLAGDGEEAIALVSARPFDVIILDLAMPGLNGFQVARAIRQRDPGVPVLLVTGWGAQYPPEELRAHGVDRILSKPLQLDDILSALAACRPAESRGRLSDDKPDHH